MLCREWWGGPLNCITVHYCRAGTLKAEAKAELSLVLPYCILLHSLKKCFIYSCLRIIFKLKPNDGISLGDAHDSCMIEDWSLMELYTWTQHNDTEYNNRIITAIFAKMFKGNKTVCTHFCIFSLLFAFWQAPVSHNGTQPDLARPLIHKLSCPCCQNESIHSNGNGLCVGHLYFSSLTVM